MEIQASGSPSFLRSENGYPAGQQIISNATQIPVASAVSITGPSRIRESPQSSLFGTSSSHGSPISIQNDLTSPQSQYAYRTSPAQVTPEHQRYVNQGRSNCVTVASVIRDFAHPDHY